MSEDTLFSNQRDSSAQTDETVGTRKFLIFMCGELKLGVYAEYVVEILTNQSITYLPMVPDHIRGIINMRGQMIPIVDIQVCLGKPPMQENMIIVLNMDGLQLGLLAEAVDQMTDIPIEDILPMPTQGSQLLVSGMCSLPDGSGTMMVLDCAQLMPND